MTELTTDMAYISPLIGPKHIQIKFAIIANILVLCINSRCFSDLYDSYPEIGFHTFSC
jgi:hypothetical protein